MAYPPPPGVANNSHPSLPPRPPASKVPASKFTPAFSSAPSYKASPTPSTSYASAPTYAPAPPALHQHQQQQQYGATASPAAYPAYAVAGVGGAGRGYANSSASYQYPQQQQQQQQPSYGQPSYYGASADYATPPQIRNPFPTPNTAQSGDYDPDMAAQIAQWQSAYVPKDAAGNLTNAPAGAMGGAPATAYGAQPEAAAAVDAASAAAAAAAAATEKKKTVYREGGGKKWQDDTLLEWDPSHLRLFVGNLAGETTDESLLKAFSRWTSVQKARVIRDKRTTKSRGFGFVSFSDPDDFFQAAKEMNGKYIQSHPVVVRKSTTEIKTANVNHHHGKGKHNKKAGGHKGGSGAGGDTSSYAPQLGPLPAGVRKPGQKTKGGLKLLG